MKIISQGQKPEDKPYRVICGACKTIFEFSRLEAQIKPDQRDGDYLEIPCPICSKPVHAYP